MGSMRKNEPTLRRLCELLFAFSSTSYYTMCLFAIICYNYRVNQKSKYLSKDIKADQGINHHKTTGLGFFRKQKLFFLLIISIFWIASIYKFLALPSKISGNPIRPFIKNGYVLTESITYKFRLPEIGDRVIFIPAGSDMDYVGAVISIENKDNIRSYTIRSSSQNNPWIVTLDKIHRRIYYPFLSREETLKMVLSQFPQITPTFKEPAQQPTPTKQNVYSGNILLTLTPTPKRILQQATSGVLEVKVFADGKSLGYSTLDLFLPNNQVINYQTDANGYKKLENLSPGNYKIYAHYSTNYTAKEFTITAGNTTVLEITVSTVIATPTPVPDTTPPTLDTINGPYDWHEQGTCFTINGDQVHDNSSTRPFKFAWKLDENQWSSFTDNDATKCYQNLNSGSHIVSAKVKDPAGNESNQVNLNFSK